MLLKFLLQIELSKYTSTRRGLIAWIHFSLLLPDENLRLHCSYAGPGARPGPDATQKHSRFLQFTGRMGNLEAGDNMFMTDKQGKFFCEDDKAPYLKKLGGHCIIVVGYCCY